MQNGKIIHIGFKVPRLFYNSINSHAVNYFSNEQLESAKSKEENCTV